MQDNEAIYCASNPYAFKSFNGLKIVNNERISAQKMIFFIINDRIKTPTDLAE